MSVSFSSKEIEFLESTSSNKQQVHEKLKAYTRNVMDEYAKNFNRDLNGKPLDKNDLVYYAKIETQRRYDGNTWDERLKSDFKHNYRVRTKASDLRLIGEEAKAKEIEKEYIKNKDGHVILPGNLKDGKNTHVHIVVSRRDKSQSISLSPMANSKGSQNKLNGKDVAIGFDRDNFKEKAEAAFDRQFDYARDRSEFYKTLKQGKAIEKGAAKFNTIVKDPEKYFSQLAESAIKQTFQKGVSNFIKDEKPRKELTNAIKSMSPVQKKKLRQEATKKLATDLMKSTSKSLVSASIPIPASLVIKAISITANLIKSQMKSQDKSIER